MAVGQLGPLGDDQVHGLGAAVFDVGPGRVEVVVVGHDLARPAHQFEEDALAGPTLMRRQDVGMPVSSRSTFSKRYQLRAPA